MFLSQQTDEYNKTFESYNTSSVAASVMKPIERLQVVSEVANKTRRIPVLSENKGYYRLPKCNEIYNLHHIPGNVDVILPKPQVYLDWIVLWYHQDQTIFQVSFEKHSCLKLYSNGERVMGLNEPMICDIPFMSLRLTYVGPVQGWVVT